MFTAFAWTSALRAHRPLEARRRAAHAYLLLEKGRSLLKTCTVGMVVATSVGLPLLALFAFSSPLLKALPLALVLWMVGAVGGDHLLRALQGRIPRGLLFSLEDAAVGPSYYGACQQDGVRVWGTPERPFPRREGPPRGHQALKPSLRHHSVRDL